MNMPQRSILALLTAIFVIPAAANAEVRMPTIFGSHMVLQRDIEAPVWGWADPSEEVSVSFRDQALSTTAGADGKWMVRLAPLSVGDPGVLEVKGTNTLTFEDVLVGEVWVCSGQSNMEWSIDASFDPELERLAGNQPGIRLFGVDHATAMEPQQDCPGRWQLCTPETLGGFSAVGYFFGRQLHETLQVPVGLLATDWGGTPAESWTSHDHLAAHAELQPIQATWAERVAAYNPDKARSDYETALAAWEDQVAAARAEGRPEPGRPQMAQDPTQHPHHPSVLYNAMIAPIVPFAIRGAIWYQGESNAGRAYQYRTLMPTMIQSWRDAWGQSDFPFYQVQLANFLQIQPEPGDSAWAELREAQALTLDAIPNVGMACIIDIGSATDIHPKDKYNVGRRLARAALVEVYEVAGITKYGPTYRSLDIVGSDCVIHFDNLGEGGLRGLISYYNEPLTGFAIAGADHKWVWGNARIEGETVIVSHPDVPEPLAVRYNWADNPQGNLYNQAYLPAWPFRTDDWTGVTEGKLTP